MITQFKVHLKRGTVIFDVVEARAVFDGLFIVQAGRDAQRREIDEGHASDAARSGLSG